MINAYSHKIEVSLLALVLLLAATSSANAGTVIPERYNQGPRVLFNTDKDLDKLDEIVPGQFYQKYWHGPRTTVQHILFTRDSQGNHVKITKPGGYHGEEVVIGISGVLSFSFPDSGESFDVGPGDVFHFPTVLHYGGCITDRCHAMVVYTPNRADFGPEGAKMTVESNVALTR